MLNVNNNNNNTPTWYIIYCYYKSGEEGKITIIIVTLVGCDSAGTNEHKGLL